MKRILVIIALSVALVSCATVPKFAADRVLLGGKDIGFGAQDVIITFDDQTKGFRGLYFEVSDNELSIYDVVVVFGDGQKQQVRTKLDFNAGTHSRLIKLKGGMRHIRAVELKLKTSGSWLSGTAHISVYGIP